METDQPEDPTKLTAKLNSPLDLQKAPMSELRLKVSSIANSDIFILRVSSVTGVEVSAVIPSELLNHGPRTYRVELQTRNGEYTMKGSDSITLEFSKVRLDIKVSGNGSVDYPDKSGNRVSCPSTCDTSFISTNGTTNLIAKPSAEAVRLIHGQVQQLPAVQIRVRVTLQSLQLILRWRLTFLEH